VGEHYEQLRAALAERYTIRTEIGRGGMSVVYLAQDLRHGRDVAIKVLRPELSTSIGSDRFLREIQIEAQMQHPNILTMHESGIANSDLYYVMPYVDGVSLRDRLNDEERLSIDEAVQIAAELGEALAYAHGKGIVHRDVKPENVMLSSGHAMLMDFGIARAVADVEKERITESGIAIGTPEYMSPEQAGGSDKIDGRSDIYSLGCILFEMLAGEPPFTGRTAQAVIARHMHERLPSISVVRPGIPAHLIDTIEKALAKVAADRYANATEFVKAVRTEPEQGRIVKKVPVSVATVVGVLGVIAGGVWVADLLTRPPLESHKVALLPLAEEGVSASDAGVGRGVSYLIEAALEHAEPLRVTDVTDRLSEAELANVALVGARRARALARDQGAAYYLRGLVHEHADSTTVTLELHDVRGDSLVLQRSAAGPTGLTPLHHLGIDALKELLPVLVGLEDVDLSPLRDRRASAVALWWQGEREYRQSNFETAYDLYSRALAEDSALAMAAVKGAQAASWNKQLTQAHELTSLVLERDSLLPLRYRYLARGLEGYLTGRADTALYWLQLARQAAPEWGEAWMATGEVYYHLLPPQGDPDSMAAAAFDSALLYDEGFTPPLFHLAEIAIRTGDVAEAENLIARYLDANPDTTLLRQLTLMRDCAAGEDFDRLLQQGVVATSPLAVIRASKALSPGGAYVDCAEQGFKRMLAMQNNYYWGAFLGLQGILAAEGRDKELAQLVDSLVEAGVAQARLPVLLDVIAGSGLHAEAEEVERWALDRYGEGYATMRRDYLLWLFGVWHAYRGEWAMLGPLRQRLIEQGDDVESPNAQVYAHALAVYDVELERQGVGHVIDALGSLATVADGETLEWQFAEPLPVERMLLAELLFSQGDLQRAHDVAAVFDHSGPVVYLPFVPKSLVVRYRAATALGDRRLAERYRERLQQLGRVEMIDSLR
jgi:serine/threonine protein kinase/tetratricopeptide (TPR) repeat protein